jgi:peptide deformylase
MSVLNVLHYPDPRLRHKALSVTHFDAVLHTLVSDMFETMYDAPGIGLAAIQINVKQAVIVIDISEGKNQPLCLINPEITAQSGELHYQEGCLSVPDIYEKVTRAETIQVSAHNQHGEAITVDASDLLAVCIQHEIDHLQGKLFVDTLSSLKQQRIRKKMEKSQRHAQEQ